MITKIEVNKKNKSRASIYIDYKYSFSLDLEVILKNNLKVGMELTDKQLSDLQSNDSECIAYNSALKLLSHTPKTEKEMYRYLLGKKLNNESVESIINRLKKIGYINDSDYADAYINYKSAICGRNKIKMELLKKGINNTIINEKLNDLQNFSSVQKIADKYMKNKEKNIQTKQKLYRFLVQKGFTSNEISTFLNEFWEDSDGSWD